MPNWLDQIKQIDSALRALSVTNKNGVVVDCNIAFQKWVDIALAVRENNKTIFLIGNGASASMASHVAADLAKNAQIRTEVFSDLSLITAIANDVSYEEVFVEPLKRRMTEGDMLVAISSSGQSQNVLRATSEANNRQGFVITLSSMKPTNPLKDQGFLNYYVPSETYGLAETCHAAILHYWIDEVVSSIIIA